MLLTKAFHTEKKCHHVRLCIIELIVFFTPTIAIYFYFYLMSVSKHKHNAIHAPSIIYYELYKKNDIF